jgi:metal-responsive CopG/Arc/MetJ family transcriptional regulator
MWTEAHTIIEASMLRTIQITLPERLLVQVDETVTALNTNRSAFARQAFE